ncbi:PAS domain-containing sensor histidine kinase [Bdellovibrio sp. BCCA]|uniref:PAS domain-containing sensor histidine kinase n=1 Tax=Bdellovibrio sp. BCCA TaxID=3136281 RepID=UPI0030F085A3
MDKKQLQDEAAILEKINNAISDSIYIFDLKEENLIWLNKRGPELYGYTLEEIRRMGSEYYARTMHPDDIPSLREGVAKSRNLKDGEVMSLEYRFKDRDGKYHWHSDRITVFSRNEAGEVTAILGVATDINDRKEFEETQKKTIEKLNLSLSAAKMGTWEWDVEKNQLLWDQRMYEIHGVPNIPSMNPLEEVWKRSNREDMEIVNMKVQEAAEKHQDFYVTYRITHKNQEVHHIRCYGKYLSNESSQRMYGVAWDSTEEILTEQQINEAKAKLISAAKMAALGEMSGGIAHEINNPLTVIQARAFQLSQMVENGKTDPEKIKQAAESISRTADKIARIVKSLRSFAREGAYDPFEVVSLKQIIDETLEFCRTRFYNHGVEIEVGKIDEELEVECRLIQIEQVLLNLLNNSFDAIQYLENKWIRISVKEWVDSVEITVTDSGPGIPSDIANQMMLPFFTTKEVGKGTGLGLSISAGIMRAHKGSLSLNHNSANTSFVIHLPKWQQEEALNY